MDVAAISADGTAILGMLRETQNAGIWINGRGKNGYFRISKPLFPLGMSGDGSKIVGYDTDGPVYWTRSEGVRRLGSEGGGRAFASSVDGRIVVGSTIAGGVLCPCRWVNQRIELLGKGGEARGVSGDGAVVVGRRRVTNYHYETLCWTDRKTSKVRDSQFPHLSFNGLAPMAISADASTIIGYLESLFEHTELPFRSSKGLFGRWTAQPLGPTAPEIWQSSSGWAPAGTRALAVSGDGSVIVGYYQEKKTVSPGPWARRAFYWTRRFGFQRLESLLAASGVKNAREWHLSAATAVSADGRTVAGEGECGQAWVVSFDINNVNWKKMNAAGYLT